MRTFACVYCVSIVVHISNVPRPITTPVRDAQLGYQGVWPEIDRSDPFGRAVKRQSPGDTTTRSPAQLGPGFSLQLHCVNAMVYRHCTLLAADEWYATDPDPVARIRYLLVSTARRNASQDTGYCMGRAFPAHYKLRDSFRFNRPTWSVRALIKLFVGACCRVARVVISEWLF